MEFRETEFRWKSCTWTWGSSYPRCWLSHWPADKLGMLFLPSSSKGASAWREQLSSWDFSSYTVMAAPSNLICGGRSGCVKHSAPRPGRSTTQRSQSRPRSPDRSNYNGFHQTRRGALPCFFHHSCGVYRPTAPRGEELLPASFTTAPSRNACDSEEN